MTINESSHLGSDALALAARAEILNMTHRANASHVGSALSVVDILAVLYAGGANISAANLDDTERDIVILSKGHSAAALYAVLGLKKFFPLKWLNEYSGNAAPLGGHVTSKGVPGVELSTGSLGHGLPYGLGIALSRLRKGIGGHVFVIMSDGECDEGTTWESAMIASHHGLKNLTVIVDRNGIQSLASTEQTLALEPFAEKWRAFGWDVVETPGHDHAQILKSLISEIKPRCLIANTVKGKGIDFMENSVLWHYKSPSKEDLDEAKTLLKVNYP
jgi:transketolase